MLIGLKTVYDIRAHGGIPPYSTDQYSGWIVSFVAVSIFYVVLSLATKKKGFAHWSALPAVGVLLSGYLALDCWDRRGTIDALASGKLRVVEGCVTDFRTHAEPRAARNSFPDEEWRVQGRAFGYKDTNERPGYNKIEALGGVVHQGQYLRVSYLISPIYRRQEIMKLEIGRVQCAQT